MMSWSLVSAFSLSPGDDLSTMSMASSFAPSLSFPPSSRRKNVRVARVRASAEADGPALTGIVFQPFQEVKREDLAVPLSPQLSIARQYYSEDCEAAINEQINVEYTVSYVYHAMYAYFDRDNIALKGLAKFYKESSGEEREHAEKLMEYQNKRGGKVKLHSILMPPSEYDHAEKGDALYSMELALSLEKLTNEKLLSLHSVAERNNDPELADFIESEFLHEQVEAIKKMADFVTQLRIVGKGHGTNPKPKENFVLSAFYIGIENAITRCFKTSADQTIGFAVFGISIRCYSMRATLPNVATGVDESSLFPLRAD